MPDAITYEITTNPDIPGWDPGAFSMFKRGIAYEADGFYIHFYGEDNRLWRVSAPIAASEAGAGDLEGWVTRTFGASNLEELKLGAGRAVEGVWRPGLAVFDQLGSNPTFGSQEQRAAEQSLVLLVTSLQELFLSVEPEGPGLDAYGPKMRELLILASTEVEDAWTYHLRRAGVSVSGQGYSTNDYVKLRDPLHLTDFKIGLAP